MAISLASLNRSDVMRPPIILGHGTNGIGKSSFGYFAPNPIIFDIEDGLILNARNSAGETAPKPPSWRITNFSEMMEAFGVLYSEEHDFQTLEVDTLDWLEREIIWPETCRRKGYASVQAIDFEKGYIDALEVWREYTDAIRALRKPRDDAPRRGAWASRLATLGENDEPRGRTTPCSTRTTCAT